MAKGRRYTIGAAFADFYILGIVIGAVAALMVAFARRPVPLGTSFLILALNILAAIIYHAAISAKTQFRSPGELMMGRKIVERRKEWTNPYGRNRSIMFIVAFVALILAANSWDSVSDESLYTTLTLPRVILRMLPLLILIVGLLRFGSGRASGGYLVAFYFLMMAIATWTNSIESPMAGFLINFGVIMLAISIAAALLSRFYYGRGTSLE